MTHSTRNPSLQHIRRRQFLALAAVPAGIASMTGVAQAQSFPSRPISLVVPFPPGGTTDIAGRAIALEMSKLMGQSLTVDNRGGAGGNVGAEYVARAAPNGYTLLMTTTNIHAINPIMYSKMGFDPNKDFVPVAPLLIGSLVLVTNPSVPATNIQELLAYAQANPGRVTCGSPGAGTLNHLGAELLKQMAGGNIEIAHYRGAGPALADVVAGHVQLLIDSIPSAQPYIRSGKLRGIATTGATRGSALPELPTVAEAGFPGLEASVWFGLLAPAGTPRDIAERLSVEATKGANSPEFRQRMMAAGFEVIAGSPDKLASMIKADVARWGPIVKSSGAKVD